MLQKQQNDDECDQTGDDDQSDGVSNEVSECVYTNSDFDSKSENWGPKTTPQGPKIGAVESQTSFHSTPFKSI